MTDILEENLGFFHKLFWTKKKELASPLVFFFSLYFRENNAECIHRFSMLQVFSLGTLVTLRGLI